MKLKKVFCGLLAAMMAGVMLCPMTAMAIDAQEADAPIAVEVQMTREEFEQLEYVEGINNTGDIMPLATGLITRCKLDMGRGGSTIVTVYAGTDSIPEVSKCGFTELRLQRRINANYAWENYWSRTDLFEETQSFSRVYDVYITPGYQYRLYGVHYAYKNIFSTQKIENSTSYMTF